MNAITKTVRSLDADAYRVFRSKAVELGMTTGEALTEAMRLWVNARNRPRVVVRAVVDSHAAEAPTAAPPATTIETSTSVQTA